MQAKLKLGIDVIAELHPKEEPKTTLKQYYAKFERVYLNSTCRESTAERYDGGLKIHVSPRLGDTAIDEITREDVKELVAELVAKKLARPTIRIITACLCAVLNHAIEDKVITYNPATKLTKFYKQAHVKHEIVEPLTPAEVSDFLAAAQAHDGQKRYKDVPDYYPLFLCAIHTGMRAGELIGLQWGDIDWKSKFIMVRRTIKNGQIYPTKTSKIHKIDMSDALLAELRDLQRRRKEEYLKKGLNQIGDWVFANSDGNFLDIQNVKNRHFHKCLEKAGIRHIRFHKLRHTFASLLIQNGEPLAYVKDQLGHASIKMTCDIYGHLIPGANRQAVNRLPVAGNSDARNAALQIGTINTSE